MILRLYPKFARNNENNQYLNKIDKDIYELKQKLELEKEIYKNTVFEDYYYIANNDYENVLKFPFNDIIITKTEQIITMNELPKENQKFVYLEFTYGGVEYKGYIPLKNYIVWSRKVLDKSVKINESDYYQTKTIQIPNAPYRIDSIDSTGNIIGVNYFKTLTTEDQTSTTTSTYQDFSIETLQFTLDMLKESFYDGTNSHYRKEDLVSLFTCNNKKNKKYYCELPSGEIFTQKEKNVFKSDPDYDFYVTSSQWKSNTTFENASVFGANEVGDEITNIKIGLPLILKNASSGTVTAINLEAVPFYPKFDYEDYKEYGFGSSNEIIEEKIAELEKIKNNIIAQKSMTYFDFPINKDYSFKLTDEGPLDEEIKSAVNNLAFGIPEKVTNLDNATREMNFREQEAFNQFGTSTLKTKSSKTNIKVNTIEGIIETSTVSGILSFLRLLYLSTPKMFGNNDNLFMGFTNENEKEILEYLQDIQNLINSDRMIEIDIKKDNLYKEGSSIGSVFNLITDQIKSYFDLGANILESAVDETIGSSIKEKDDNFKTSSSVGLTADYVDFSLYEIVDDKEYFLFDSRNVYNDQGLFDKLLNNNTKFATIGIPAFAGATVGGWKGFWLGGAIGATTLGVQELFGDKTQFDENKKEFETNFIITRCNFTFSSVSGKIADGLTFPTYVKYSINLETKKPPLLNDVLRMLLLQQMIVSEDRTVVDKDITKTMVDTPSGLGIFDETVSSISAEQLLSLSVDKLKSLPDEYLESLPDEVREKIIEKIK